MTDLVHELGGQAAPPSTSPALPKRPARPSSDAAVIHDLSDTVRFPVDAPARPLAAPGSVATRPGAARPVVTADPAPPQASPLVHSPVGPVSAPSASSAGIRVEASSRSALDVNALLLHLLAKKGSDLHLSVGSPPLIRVNGEMEIVPGQPVLTAEAARTGLYDLINEEQRAIFEDAWELDFAHTIAGVSRFRVNLMMQRAFMGAVFRAIPTEIKPLEALGMPGVLYKFAGLPRGLVLVTGPTGSGKSTTLAALIDHANRTRSGHILTIEDPIEFLHPHRSCVVNQREVGADTRSFAGALKHVLRQDPDIILIGELRDLETISIALTAAETGHLVFATLHTQSAQDTVNRIIDVFPGDQQQQIRSQLAATLKGVVCQTLVKSADGKGRAAAAEIMVVNAAVANMIRRADTHQLHQTLQSGGAEGMQTLNQHLSELVAKGVIERPAAEEVATDLKDLDALIQGRQALQPRSLHTQPAKGGGLSGSSSF